MKTCMTCVFQYRAICLLTRLIMPDAICDDYEEPKPPREKAKEVWG